MQDAIIGTVMAVGEDVELTLVAGDVVIFSKCAQVERLESTIFEFGFGIWKKPGHSSPCDRYISDGI